MTSDEVEHRFKRVKIELWWDAMEVSMAEPRVRTGMDYQHDSRL